MSSEKPTPFEATFGVPPIEPEEALQRLDSLVDAVLAEEDITQAKTRLAGFLGQTDAPALLAVVDEEVRFEGLLMRLGARHGFKQHADRLRDMAAKAAQDLDVAQRRAEFRVAAPDEPERPADVVLRVLLGGHSIPTDLYCPEGWILGPDGVQQIVPSHAEDKPPTLLPVCPTPVVITGRTKDIHDATTSLCLEYLRRRRWERAVVPRRQAMDSRQIVELADRDLPVNSNTSRALVSYLSSFEARNLEALPQALTSSRMGWVRAGERRGFLWGRAFLDGSIEVLEAPSVRTGLDVVSPTQWGADGVHLLAHDGTAELAAGFVASGTWEGWLKGAERLRDYPRVMLALYVALLPPLLELLPRCPNLILDIAGQTTQGKTTTLRIAASAWGNPDERDGGVVFTWDNTRVWTERALAFEYNLPLLLDDTKLARYPRDVAHILYAAANGRARGRGTLKGIQATPGWRTTLISTGESPATSFTQDAGTRTRTLSLWGSPFGGANEKTSADIAEINRCIFEHHGHLGPRLVTWLMGADHTAAVQDAFERAHAIWQRRAQGDAIANRAAGWMAGLHVVSEILHEKFAVPRPHEDPLQIAWGAVGTAQEEADRPAEALASVLGWATQHQDRFYDGHRSKDTPYAGWLGCWEQRANWTELAVIQDPLTEQLQKLGHEPEGIYRAWEERGWLDVPAGKGRTHKRSVGGRRVRCVVLKREAFDVLDTYEEPEDGTSFVVEEL
ncbi:MAG: DUF927 domain-containing protein [Polyangiaceae bacterium]|nr:DUF927 domain-containing protein [Polyangiaceae bacterium]